MAADPTPTPEVVNATVCPACGSPVVVESSRGGSTHHYRPVGHVADLRAEVARLAAERDALRAALQQYVDYEQMNAGKYDKKYGAGAGLLDLHIERALVALAGPPPAATEPPFEGTRREQAPRARIRREGTLGAFNDEHWSAATDDLP